MSAPGVRATLRALMTPRRLLPMLLVAASLLLAQAAYEGDRLGVPLAALMCGVFFAVAPVSWRLLFFEPMPLPRAAVLTAIYGAIGVGFVSVLGLMLPRWLQMGPTLLTRPSNLVVCVALFLVGGWGLATAALVVTYRIGFSGSLRPGALLLGAAATGSMVSGMSLGLVLVLRLPLSFGRAYGGFTSAGVLATVAGWMWLLHAVLLVGLVLTRRLDARLGSNGRGGGN